MAFLNEIEKQQLRAAIRQAEAKTHGEIVTVIAHASGNYFYYPTLWAALLAILSPVVLLATPWSLGPLGIVEFQLVVFALLAVSLRWAPIKRWLVPHEQQRLYCARRAREQFLVRNLHTTRERAGVLLYVSLFEHHVELLADAGIHARVPEGTWNELIRRFTARIQDGQIGDGFIEAVNAIGTHLATHFPADGTNPNELSDHLIEL